MAGIDLKDTQGSIEYFSDPYEAVKGAHAIALITDWKEFAEYDYDRIFAEIMERDGCVSSNNIKEFILDHVEELGKEYFVRGEAE